MASKTVAGMKVIPSGMKIVTAKDGTTYLQSKPRTRKRYKLPKKVRDKIALAARKVKIPVLTVGANMPAAIGALNYVNEIATTGWRADKGIRLASAIISPYTGVVLTPTDIAGNYSVKWDFMELYKGLIPNAFVFGLNKLGIFKSANQRLAKAKIPLRIA